MNNLKKLIIKLLFKDKKIITYDKGNKPILVVPRNGAIKVTESDNFLVLEGHRSHIDQIRLIGYLKK